MGTGVSTGNYSNQGCTEAVRIRLQNDVNNYCKSEKTKFTDADACPTLTHKMEIINKCISARMKINSICFQGGDPGHNQAIAEKLKNLVNCQGIYFSKCIETVPLPKTVPVEIPQPKTDGGFMKKMEELTGLAGAALIVYIIISEGSRLFPPRNLIPVP